MATVINAFLVERFLACFSPKTQMFALHSMKRMPTAEESINIGLFISGVITSWISVGSVIVIGGICTVVTKL